MTPILNEVVLALQVLVLLAIAAVLWYAGWRRYRLDLFRQRLFALRDELFDVAADGKIQFNDYAYGGLRRLLNNSIRFGHRVNSTQVIAISLFAGDPPETIDRLYRDWLESIERIEDADVRAAIQSIHERLMYEMVTKIVVTSVPMLATLGVGLGGVLVFGPLFWGAKGAVQFVAGLGSRLPALTALEEELEAA